MSDGYVTVEDILSDLPKESLARLKQILSQQRDAKRFHQLDLYAPYEWQEDFLSGGKFYKHRILQAGNRTGKTYTGAYETALHVTGRYPNGWRGKVFHKPIKAWVAGVSTTKTRDVIQRELLGEPSDSSQIGTGSIPKEDIVKLSRAPGVPDAFQAIVVKHHDPITGEYDGNSIIQLLSYEMGKEKFMGTSIDMGWLDEEPPYDIFSQIITRTADKRGIVFMTFTPERGRSQVVRLFSKDNIKDHQQVYRATWDDCPHLTEEVKQELLSSYLPHERDMRSKGLPVFGTGLVFPVSLDDILVEPKEVPDYWLRIAAVDFGWDHPTAFIVGAFDADNDTFYVIDCFKKRKASIPELASRMRSKGQIPVAWPHDGNREDSGSGSIASQYRAEGINMLPFHFTNPPTPDNEKGDNLVEPGIMEMYTYMTTGRFKVFKTLTEWQLEFLNYYRDEKGQIVKEEDDLMAATRYAFMSRRYARHCSSGGQWKKLVKPDYTGGV